MREPAGGGTPADSGGTGREKGTDPVNEANAPDWEAFSGFRFTTVPKNENDKMATRVCIGFSIA